MTESTSNTAAASLLRQFELELGGFTPFGQMSPAERRWVLERAQQRYFAPDAVMLSPADGDVSSWFIIRRGNVQGVPRGSGVNVHAFEYEAGDVFPVGAALAGRPVVSEYRAVGDVFAWVIPAQAMRELVASSPVFADFANGRVQHLLSLSQAALRQTSAERAMSVQSLERPLSQIVRSQPLSCLPDTSLQEALTTMHQRRVGSILVVDESHALQGILTRYDVLSRVCLAGLSLSEPIHRAMTQPVYALEESQTAQDAALLMSQHGIRHVPVLREGRVRGIVSERDLFALQRLSINQVSGDIRAAQTVDEVSTCAQNVRRLAQDLLAQGVQAKQLTALISHLNDSIAQQLVRLACAQHGVEQHEFCWLALGSEGRSEQTIATDQDNALVVADGVGPERLGVLQTMAGAVNEALDRCGFPLCQGGIMAGQEQCFLRLSEWKERFGRWARVGEPEHLLAAAIYFDFRAVAGNLALAKELREAVTPLAVGNKKFLLQLAATGLQQEVPLTWRGRIDTTDHNGIPTVDLKLQGTALVVAIVRVFALAHGCVATSTVERLRFCAPLMGVQVRESEAWVTAFEFLQMIRLRVQLELLVGSGPIGDNEQPALAVASDEPNRLAIMALNNVDRRMLRESFRAVDLLQQRLRMDYGG